MIEEIEAQEAIHSPRRRIWKDGRNRDDLCTRCRTTHPCPTRRFLAELRDRDEKLEAVEAWAVQYGGWTPEEHDAFLGILQGGK